MEISGVVLVLILLPPLSLGVGLGYIIRKRYAEAKVTIAENEAKKILTQAQKEAATIKKEALLQAKEEFFKTKSELDKETKEERKKLQNLERRLLQKEENLDKKVDIIEQKEKDFIARKRELSNTEKRAQEKENKYRALMEEQKVVLEKISGISSEEAKKLLMQSMESEAKHDAVKTIRKIEENTKEEADKIAKNIISLAIQRYASDYVAEKTVSVVNLPSDDMKGRIIGREGRNIRAIEATTGVDLIIDDTPEAIILSCHDPIRREIAKVSMERLITDGRIHPARIEEIVDKVKEETETAIKEAGEELAFNVGIHRLHSELIKLLGKLKFRTSFDQNVLQHSREVAFLCGIMASELGVNVKQAKRAGLLHDIGKAVDHEVEGPHATIGADLAKKYGEVFEITHAIAAHHDDEKPQTVIAVLVQAADALSAARPGARKETLTGYLKRLKALEEIANSFSGVTKSYAIQAGREVRVIVENKNISDEIAIILSRDIAKKIEGTLSYPGQIKVTVIRETRAIEFAR